MTTSDTAARGIELLNQLLVLQSERDGVPRAPIGVVGSAAGSDPLARDVGQVAQLIFAAQHGLPLVERLTQSGRDLEARGLIKVAHGDSYAEAALERLLLAVGP